MFVLDCEIKPYAWGSHSAIASLMRRASPSKRPEAELWMGAHPLGSSRVRLASGDRSLLEWAAAEPERVLGQAHQQRFGRLSFLLKVLAADQPLSLQVHPSLEQARAGFAREEAANVPRDANERNYKDDNHKPELLVALGRFEALSGFREASEAKALLDRLRIPTIDALLAASSSLKELFAAILSLSVEERTEIAAPLVEATTREAKRGDEHALALGWAAELATRYPGDPGAPASLLLRYVSLVAGEGVYLGAGNLHAYLRGVGIEIMASSDNVLRGGLTPKHVDIGELLRVIDFDAEAPAVLSASKVGPFEWAYDTPAAEFRLSRLELTAGASVTIRTTGPEILLVTRGSVTGTSAEATALLGAGDSAFVPAVASSYELSGDGEVFRARAGA